MDTTLFDLAPFSAEKTPLKESFNVTRPIAERIAEALRKLESKGWPDNYHVVQNDAQMESIRNSVVRTGRLIFDAETSGLNPWRDRVYCISMYVDGHAYVIPFEHQMMKCVSIKTFRDTLGPLFSDPLIKRINHNIKFDGHFMEESLKIPFGDIYCDTLLQSWVIDPTTDHGLKELCERNGWTSGGNYSKQFGKTAWSYIHPRLAAYYACLDVELVHRLLDRQNVQLTKKPRLSRLFWNTEMPVQNIAFDMERQGVDVDMDYVENTLKPTVYTEYERAAKALAPFIEPYLKDVDAKTVTDVLESPKKLYVIFFDRLGVPERRGITLRKNPKTGEFTKRSLDKEAIAEFKRDYECVRLLGDYRKVATVKKMFVDKLPELVVDGKIHPTINTIGTDTGRMSFSDPNLQQIPSRMGPLVRNMFVPRPGYVFCSMDFSGQEMRIQAHFSKPQNAPPTWRGRLVDFYLNEPAIDIYSQTAIEVLPDGEFDKFDNKGLTKSRFAKMTKDERKKTLVYGIFKSLVLGLGYGMGPKKFARQVGISDSEAKRLYALYFETYPELKLYQYRAIDFAEKNGFIVTLLGRERPLPFINSPDKKYKGQDERAAMNTPIQGTAADQVKRAMIDSQRLIRINSWPVRIALVVHDEIIFEMQREWAIANRPCIEQIRDALTNALPLIVPMRSSITIEPRWGTETDLDKLASLEEAA